MKCCVRREAELSRKERKLIGLLLRTTFPGYPEDRIFFRQLPSFRIVLKEEGHIAAHSAIDHRVIKVGSKLLTVWGIQDFCVDRSLQHQGLGSLLMTNIIEQAGKANVEFLVLTSGDSDFYKKFDFKRKKVRAKWVMIHNDGLFGIQDRRIEDVLYVKEISSSSWPEGNVDFLGTMF
jgi:GNAT superfamily N-acetyltransferase